MSITPTKQPVETQRTSTALEAYRFLGDGKNAASLKQIRAALSFAYKHWDLKNPFGKIDPPLHKEPQIRYLLLADIRRLLDYLKVRQQGYGSALAFHLANALFQTACRFEPGEHKNPGASPPGEWGKPVANPWNAGS